jgi:hypothetical protein
LQEKREQLSAACKPSIPAKAPLKQTRRHT